MSARRVAHRVASRPTAINAREQGQSVAQVATKVFRRSVQPSRLRSVGRESVGEAPARGRGGTVAGQSPRRAERRASGWSSWQARRGSRRLAWGARGRLLLFLLFYLATKGNKRGGRS